MNECEIKRLFTANFPQPLNQPSCVLTPAAYVSLPPPPLLELLPGALLVIKVECTIEDKTLKKAAAEHPENIFLYKHSLLTEPKKEIDLKCWSDWQEARLPLVYPQRARCPSLCFTNSGMLKHWSRFPKRRTMRLCLQGFVTREFILASLRV